MACIFYLVHLAHSNDKHIAYSICNTTGKYGLHDDAGTLAPDDAESKSRTIVYQIYYFKLSPFCI